jgi:hypothetical protein
VAVRCQMVNKREESHELELLKYIYSS